MANGVSAYATALIASPITRNIQVNYHDYHAVRHTRKDVITVLGNEASAAYHDLGPIMRDGTFLIPEECRMRFNNAGNFSVTLTLQRVYAAAVPLAASFSATGSVATFTTAVKHNLIAGQVIYLTSISNGTTTIAAGGGTSVTVASVTGDLTFTVACTATVTSGTAVLGVIAGGVQNFTTAVAAVVAATTCGTTSIVFVPVTGGPALPLLVGERLRLEFTVVTTVTAGRLINLELCFDAPSH